MKGQVAVELLLVASLAGLVLFWLGNYMDQWQQGTVATVALEERSVASSLARLVNRAGGSQVNLTHTLPCIISGSQTIVYNVNATETTLILSTLTPSANTTALLAYNTTGFLVVGCEDSTIGRGTEICIYPQAGNVQLLHGACSS